MIRPVRQKRKNTVQTIGRILIPIIINQDLKALKIIRILFKAKIKDSDKDLTLAEEIKTSQPSFKRNISNYMLIVSKTKISISYHKKDT